MENTASLKNMISKSLQDIRTMLDANTVTGNPITLKNGVTVIPISRVSMGFASGGIDLPARGRGEKIKDFGGGGGTGVTVTPVGFLTIFKDGHAELIPAAPEGPGPVEQINDILTNAPQIAQRIKEIFSNEATIAAKEKTVQETVRHLESPVDIGVEKKKKRK